jgi:hypothetical protein
MIEPAEFVLTTASGVEITERHPIHVSRYDTCVYVHRFVHEFEPKFSGTAEFYVVLLEGVPIARAMIESQLNLFTRGPFKDRVNLTVKGVYFQLIEYEVDERN